MALEFLNDAYFAAKVGIGTDSPVSIVDIFSTAPTLTIGGVAVNQVESGRIRFTEDASTADFQGSYIHYDGSANKMHIGVHETANDSVSNDLNAITIRRVNGYVGIGNVSPGYRLSVNGTIQSDLIRAYTYPTNSFLDFDDDQTASANHTRLASVGRIAYLADTNANEPAANAAHEFFTGTSDIDTATSLMIIETSGNVGIGETAPISKLQVGTVMTSNTITIGGYYGLGGGSLAFRSGHSNPANIWDTASILATDDGNFNGKIEFKTSTASKSVPSIKMVIKADGNVGIGNTSPGAKLVVGANVNTAATGIEVNAGASGANVLNAGSADNWFPYIDANNYYSASEHIFRSEVNSATRMTIKSDGKVGIGIILPTEKLEVVGNIKITAALLSNQENTDVDTGTETVANVAIATYTAAFFDFVIKKTTNVRSGTVYACHDGTNVEFTETSTQDLGDTSDVTLSVDISGGNMRLLATVTSDDWSVKSLIRAI